MPHRQAMAVPYSAIVPPDRYPFGGMAHPNHAKALLRFRAFLCMVGFPRQKFFSLTILEKKQSVYEEGKFIG